LGFAAQQSRLLLFLTAGVDAAVEAGDRGHLHQWTDPTTAGRTGV